MRITFLLLFGLLIACSEDESPEPVKQEPPIEVELPVVKECRLVKLVALTATQTVETSYSYNDKGQIIGQIRTRNGAVDFSYVISYTADGFVDKVDQGEFTLKHSYTSDAKIQKLSMIDDATSQVIQTINYVWDANSVEITFQRTDKAYPYQTSAHEFSGDNIVRTVHKSYDDFDNGKLGSVIEIDYTGFDTGLNQYYVASKDRPGYGVVSKNNYAKEYTTHTVYKNDEIVDTSNSTKTYTYVYNKANATASFVTTDETTGSSYTTNVSYEDCPE